MRTALFPLLYEAFAVFSFFHTPEAVGVPAAFLFHAASSLAAAQRLLRSSGAEGPFSWQETVWRALPIFFTPPIGLLFSFAYGPAVKYAPREKKKEFDVVERTTLSDYKRAFSEKNVSASTRPLIEILRKGNQEARLRAALSLRKGGLDPRVVTELYREALSAGDSELEVLSSTALSELEEEMDDLLGKLIEKAERTGRPEDFNAAARQFHEYAYRGLATGDLKKFYLHSAIDCLKKSLEADPDQPMIHMELVRYCLESGRVEEASRYFGESVAGGYSTPKGYFYLAEIYYRERKWEDLRKIAEWLIKQRVTDPKIEEICNFWAETCVPTYA